MIKKRLTKVQLETLAAKVEDTVIPLEIRKAVHNEIMDEVMNPKDNFDPETFDPKEGVVGFEAKRRSRIPPPARLPTLGMKPKQLLEGQMVGMYESKQDLYLIMAHYINDLLDRIEVLEKGTTPK